LAAVASSVALPPAFRRFIEDLEPRRHIRSATACYLDLGQFAVQVGTEGTLVHFLSDQQWVLHWLLYLGPGGSEAVVVTPDALGFDDGESPPIRQLGEADLPRLLAVCALSFEEFLYRFWAMNEIFFRVAVDKVPVGSLPEELRSYALAHPKGAGWPWAPPFE
jgi:hypothetical protein